jgi:hypothetical protein
LPHAGQEKEEAEAEAEGKGKWGGKHVSFRFVILMPGAPSWYVLHERGKLMLIAL